MIFTCLLLAAIPPQEVDRAILLEELNLFAAHFPTAHVMALQSAHKDWLEGMICLGGTDAWLFGEELVYLNWSRRCWVNLFCAKGQGTQSTEYRLEALGRLRAELGDDAYDAGWMPPPISWWFLRSVN